MKDLNIKAWLQLIRIPNLWTIPADIALAYFLVLIPGQFNPFSLIFLMLISSLIYSSGLILNDLMDYDEDLRERPKRPLPSGDISKGSAWKAYFFMIIGAMLLALCLSQRTIIITSLLILAVALYNGPSRRLPKLGFVTMGLCRGLNLALGASLVMGHNEGFLTLAIIAETLYITAVTYIAYNETDSLPKRLWRWAPAAVVAVALILLSFIGNADPLGFVAALAMIAYMYKVTKPLDDESFPIKLIPPKIGEFIRLLIPISATMIFISRPEYCMVSFLLLLSFPIASYTSKLFYSS